MVESEKVRIRRLTVTSMAECTVCHSYHLSPSVDYCSMMRDGSLQGTTVETTTLEVEDTITTVEEGETMMEEITVEETLGVATSEVVETMGEETLEAETSERANQSLSCI